MEKSFLWWLSGNNFPAPEPIGVIYSKSSWTDLTDYTVQGTITTSINGSNKLVMSAAASQANTLNLTVGDHAYTSLDKWSNKMVFIVQTVINGGFVGIRSASTFAKSNICGSWSNNLLSIQGGLDGAMSTISGTTTLNAVTGNEVEIILTKNGNVFTLTGRNLTTAPGVTATLTYTYSVSNVSGVLMPNTGRFCWGAYDNNTVINSIEVSSTVLKNSKVCIITDSIGQGYSAGTWAAGYARLLNATYPDTTICGAQNDSLLDGINLLPELNVINAQKYIIAQGINDIGYGVSEANVQSRYATLAAGLPNTVLHQKYYVTRVDLTTGNAALWAYIQANYPSANVVDTTTGLVSGDLDDQLHMEASGHTKYYNNWVASGKL